MALKRSLTTLLAAAATVVLVASCSTGNDRAEAPSSARSNLILVDGDRHGYITYDTERQILSGYARSGKKSWQEKRYFPTDVHCATSCPDAVISATADMNDSESATHIIWKHGDDSATQAFGKRSLIIQWARDSETWVSTSESALTWSIDGKKHTLSIAKGISDSTGRVSEDNSTLLVSIQQNDGGSWRAFRFSLHANSVSLSGQFTKLPGNVGCLSPEQGTMWTLGEKASEFSLTTGKKIRDTPQFASDCASSGNATLLGAFSSDTEESTQDISITSGSRANAFHRTTVRSSGEIGLFRNCGVLLSNGRVVSLSAQGQKLETRILAHSALTTSDGSLYTVSPTGEVEQHTILTNGGSCRIR
jgi:hypothetical protein